MKRSLPPTLVALAITLTPAFGQALNSASYRPTLAPGGGVAQGSIFVLFGKGLGPSGLVQSTKLPLETNLEGTSVRVTIGSSSVLCFLIYTSDGQVAAVLPSNTPTGSGSVLVAYNGRASNPVSIKVVANAFGIYTRGASGIGPAVVQSYNGDGSAILNGLNSSAKPGDTVTLWGTGLGPINAYDASAPPVGDLNVEVKVLVANKEATVTYKGRAPNYPGVDIINFVIPSGVSGCYVPVAVKAAGIVSNYTSISVAADGGNCSDTASPTVADVNAALSNGTSNTATLVMNRTAWLNSTGIFFQSDTILASFRRRTSAGLLTSQGLFGLHPSPGTCTAVNFNWSTSNPYLVEPAESGTPTLLDAGTALQVTGPMGTQTFGKQGWGGFSGTLAQGAPTAVPGFLEAGAYQVLGGRSGSAIGSFRANLTVPGGITWTNASTTGAVARTSDLTITWTGGDANRELVYVRGMATDPNAQVRGVFACTALVGDGTITVPADVLAVLPATASIAQEFPDFIEVGTITRTDVGRFTAPGLDGGYLQVQRVVRQPIQFQ